jgi:hypothetical protein
MATTYIKENPKYNGNIALISSTAQSILTLNAFIQVDELKVSGGLIWNTSNHELIGFAEPKLDITSLFCGNNTKK